MSELVFDILMLSLFAIAIYGYYKYRKSVRKDGILFCRCSPNDLNMKMVVRNNEVTIECMHCHYTTDPRPNADQAFDAWNAHMREVEGN